MNLRDFYSCLRKVGLYLFLISLTVVAIIGLVILDLQAGINPGRVTASSTVVLAIVTFLLVCVSFFNLRQSQGYLEEMQKDRKIQHIAQKLEKIYYPIVDSIDSQWHFQDTVIRLFYRRYLADNDLKEKLTDYRNNLNAPDLEERRSEIKKIVKDKVLKIEEEYNRLIGG